MVARISRIVMVLLTIFLASIALPDFYRRSFKRNTQTVRLNYSEVLDKFLILGKKPGYVLDEDGKEYPMSQYENLVPLSAMRALQKRGEFPDSLKGVALEPAVIEKENYSHYIYLSDQGRYFGLMPLATGDPTMARLYNTNDMLRVNRNGIEFYNCEYNEVDREKSALFDAEFRRLGYLPPAKKLYGQFGASKYRDDGIFFVDSNDKLFRIRSYENRPHGCEQVVLPEGMVIRKMEGYADHPEVVAYIMGTKGEFLILTVDNELIPIDLDDFRFDTYQQLSIYGDMFYRMFSLRRDGAEKLFVFDKQYNLIGKYAVESDIYSRSLTGKIERAVFPFITTTFSYMWGYRIDSQWSPFAYFIWINLVLAAWMFLLKRRHGLNTKNFFNITDIVMIAAFGVYGFLAVMIYPVRK